MGLVVLVDEVEHLPFSHTMELKLFLPEGVDEITF